LIGGSGEGKSNVGNVLLDRDAFKVSSGSASETHTTECKSGIVDGTEMVVYDTKGYEDTRESPDTAHSWDLPQDGIGIDVFLFVKKWGRFRDRDLNDLRLFMQMTGEEQKHRNHTAIIFTHVENDKVQDDLQTKLSPALQEATTLVHSVLGVENVHGAMAARKTLLGVIGRIKRENSGKEWTWSQQKFDEVRRDLEEMVKSRHWTSETRRDACLDVLRNFCAGRCTIQEAQMRFQKIYEEEINDEREWQHQRQQNERERQYWEEKARSWQSEDTKWKHQQWQEEQWSNQWKAGGGDGGASNGQWFWGVVMMGLAILLSMMG